MAARRSGTLVVNALALAVLGALVAQVLHEACHGVAAVAVGGKWRAFNLFAVDWGPETLEEGRKLVIEASPALLNIVIGLLAAFLFSRAWARRRPLASLFLMYTAGYSLLMGFGYLLVDPLFYQPGGENLGDWKKVIDMLGGSWGVRLPLLLVGTAGVLGAFFWLARAGLCFARDATDKAERRRVARPLLLLPYLVINVLFTVLSLWHPLGAEGIFIVAFQYWFGYSGFFWAFFLAAYWLDVKGSLAGSRPLPQGVSWPWVTAAGCALLVAIVVLVPTLWMG